MGIEPWPQRWEARVLPLCHRGPLMRERKISNAILMVTRKHGGTNLGEQRFQLIKEVASDVLDLSYV